ncbi:MAG: multidrug effflux MFS transporter [Bdellovibrionales bacterium]|nr:multidrug effflux MFS transporter [Bdellovibrionales bacterium]
MDAPTSDKLSKTEFVSLMAIMTSVVALSIDGVLPAFPLIKQEFSVSETEIPMVVSTLFLGLGIGQLVFGPLSDVFGRKKPIYVGLAFFMMGSIISSVATSLPMLLVGRALQGFGGASPRIVSVALIRDEYSGNAMAQITSLVMTVFILVPAIAPSIGQGILWVADWRWIFYMLVAVSLLVWVWFGVRQHETLTVEKRKSLTMQHFIYGTKETFSHITTVTSMIVTGLVFGVFVGYLGVVQEIFDKIFQVNHLFPLMFAILALSLGGASYFNSRMVLALGMRKLILTALLSMAIISNLFVVYLEAVQVGAPPLWLFMAYMMLTFFSVGFLFGNLNALAMEPLGHVAGIGSAILGFVQSGIAVVIGTLLGLYMHGSVVPLVMSFGTCSLISLGILILERRFRKSVSV